MGSTLVIVRHGESTWNQENLFTGWHDVPLSARGELEATAAGTTLADEGLWFDVVHTSLLTRATRTAELALAASGRPGGRFQRSSRLNGATTAPCRASTRRRRPSRYGIERDQAVAPFLRRTAPARGRRRPRASGLRSPLPRWSAPDVSPGSECLKDVVERVLPYWYDAIVPQLRAGWSVLVVAHGNSLRALAMHLEAISTDAIAELNIPTGAPRRYRFDDDLPRRRRRPYLGDADAVAAAAAAVAAQAGG